MKLSSEHIITRIHLVISVIIVVPVAVIYGFNPSSQFDIFPNTIDEHNLLKGIMGLYIGCSVLWTLGVCYSKFYKTALLSNMAFMLCMGFGRLISIVVDGIPGQAYLIGTCLELVLGFYGLWLLSRNSSDQIQKDNYSK